MTRHRLREEIFKIVFGIDAQLKADPARSVSDIVGAYLADSLGTELSEDEEDYIYDKSVAIGEMLPELDRAISDVATGWTIRRMGRVELNIIRVALYEIRYDDSIPPKVAVNEAVNLARTYAGDEASAFVNGLLKHFIDGA